MSAKPNPRPNHTDPDFIASVEGLLAEKGLEKSDLQVYVKKEDIDDVTDLIGKDWYSFGKCMNITSDILDKIKENTTSKERKAALLNLLIEHHKIRFEEIIHGHYLINRQSLFISRILDYVASRRITREPSTRILRGKRKSQTRIRCTQSEIPWQAKYSERQWKKLGFGPRRDLSVKSYQTQFYTMLWSEEQEHIQKLKAKCDGRYILQITDDVPQEVKEYSSSRSQEFGYIEGASFTDDKIEYATQASEGVHINMPDGSYICKAFISPYNYNHIEQCLYVCLPLRTKKKLQLLCSKRERFEVMVQFEVKHSYFDHLHHGVVNLSLYVISCLIPDKSLFSDLEMTFEPQQPKYKFMKLDNDKQAKALKMITSVSSHSKLRSCPPPVILYGPFGSGKTLILARAAYEIMMNGFEEDSYIRILICAHHRQSVSSFIDFFAQFEKDALPFDVFHVSQYPSYPKSSYYKTIGQIYKSAADFEDVIIVTSYSTSLNLYDIFNGYFTHVFLDEAAQVREPEAIIPLALATRDAKIVLAGDDKQVGPMTLVLGNEAQKSGLDVSLLARLMKCYKEMGPIASSYITKLDVNYRSHESLLKLPELFYGPLHSTSYKSYWHEKGPAGYKFVCSDSRLVPEYIDKDQQLVEACIVLEEVLNYLEEIKNEPKPPQICIISSTRKQLNHIKQMVSRYSCYNVLKQKRVTFLPSFMIQGHEFQAIFLSLLEPLKDGGNKEYLRKSLFNKFVFNTVITRAKTHVVAVARPVELLDFENKYFNAENETKCWHEYLQLCVDRDTVTNLAQAQIEDEVLERLKAYQKGTKFDPATLLCDSTRVTKSVNGASLDWEYKASDSTVKEFVQKSNKIDLGTRGKELTMTKDKLTKTTIELDRIKIEFASFIENKEAEIEDLNMMLEEKDKQLTEAKNDLSTEKKISKAKDQELSTLSNRKKILKPNDQELSTLSISSKKQAPLCHNVSTSRGKKKSKTSEKNMIAHSVDAKLEGYNYRIALIDAIFLLLIIFTEIFTLMIFDQKTVLLPDVKTIASTRFLVAGGQSRQLHWEEYGLIMDVPSDALPHGFIAEVVICVSLSGPYKYPNPQTWKPASAVYWISSSKDFINPVTLGIWHNVRGKINSSSIKILTAEDSPQNMEYIFKEKHANNFSLKGPYIFLALNHFCAITAHTCDEINSFCGTLLYRESPKGKYVWDYSFIVYQCHPPAIIRKFFIDSYTDWIYEIQEIDVIFKKEQISLNLTTDLPSDWKVDGKVLPLTYSKSHLQSHGKIQSNMQFMLRWKGNGPPTDETSDLLTFSLLGALRPEIISFMSNTINDSNGNLVAPAPGADKMLSISDLADVKSELKKNSFDTSKWADLCLNLGLLQTTIETIKSDNPSGSDDCLTSCLSKWLRRFDYVDSKGGATWTVLVDALENISQKTVAEGLKQYRYQ